MGQPTLKLMVQESKNGDRTPQALTLDQVAGRVREVCRYLEEFSERLAALQFDVLNRDFPASLDCIESVPPHELAERLCPEITSCFDRLRDRLEDGAEDDLMRLRESLAEIAFAVGVLAGSVFQGADPKEIDRLEKGLVKAVAARNSE